MGEREPNFPISPDLLNQLAEGRQSNFADSFLQGTSAPFGPRNRQRPHPTPQIPLPLEQPSGITDTGDLDGKTFFFLYNFFN